MSADGINERKATRQRLRDAGIETIAGKYIDDYEIPRHPDNGRVIPHVLVDFSTPIPAARDRNLAGGEVTQPHVMGASFQCIAGDNDNAEDMLKRVIGLILDWHPSGLSSSYSLDSGFADRRPSTATTPTRYIEVAMMSVTINQATPTA